MTRTPAAAGLLLLFGLCLTIQGCSRDSETAPPGGTTPVANQIHPAGEGVTIAFRSDPDPPEAGENTFEVVLMQPDGAPITDATVAAVFSMPAMNMPAMRSTSALTHEGSGLYRGSG